MAPSRELANLFAEKNEDLDNEDVDKDNDNAVKPHKHSQALVPHPTVRSEAAAAAAPLAAELDQLASILTGDMNSMKSLLTCSICDQLLYEPWTIACGHTYCYGCLSTWFEQNRRKKSCPECRSAVRHMPAPAFVIREVVNIFVGRAEIMPAEESVADHRQRQKEEREVVDSDRASSRGLFKGTFNGSRLGTIIYDEADRIHRCGACGHEFVPGPECQFCGADFEGEEEALADDNWSDDGDEEDDMDDIDLENIEYDIEDQLDAEERALDLEGDGQHDWDDMPHFGGNVPLHAQYVAEGLRRHLGLHRHYHDLYPASYDVGDDSSEEEDSDDESAGSLNAFIANGDEDHEMDGSTPARRVNRRNRHSIVAISSDDEQEQDDEDDQSIPNRSRSRNSRARPMVIDEDEDDEQDDNHLRALPSRGRRARPQVDSDESDSEATNHSGVAITRTQRRSERPTIEDTDSEAEQAEDDNVNMEAMGWSPLANEPDSGDEESQEVGGYDGYDSAQSEEESDHTLRVDDDDGGSVQSVQWDDESDPYQEEENQAQASRMSRVPDPPRRRRPWEPESPAAHRSRRQQGGVQMSSAQGPISLDSDSDNSKSEDDDDDEDDEEVEGHPDRDIEMGVSPSRTAETADTAESEDGESLREAQVTRDEADQSSEDSLQPPRRRRRLRRLRSEDHDEENLDYFGSGSAAVNLSTRQWRLPRNASSARLGHYQSRRAEPAAPSFRSPRRAQYALNLPAIATPSRGPRGYLYNANSYSRSRPHDSYY